MLRLKKFYELVSGYTNIRLVSEDGETEYYCGKLRSIPDEYDEYEVTNFTMSNEGIITFTLKGVVA